MAVKSSSWDAVVGSHRDKFLKELLSSAIEDFEDSFKCYENAVYFNSRVAIWKKWYNNTILHAQKFQTQFHQLEASKGIERFPANQMHEKQIASVVCEMHGKDIGRKSYRSCVSKPKYITYYTLVLLEY